MADTSTVKLLEKQRTITKRGLSTQYDNTLACQTFYDSDTMSYTDKVQFEDSAGRKKRALVNFNKIQENVDAVVGFAAQNRRQAKYVANLKEASQDAQRQQLYSKNMNALYSYHRERQNADQLESEQDLDLFVCGYGAIETDLSYIMGNSTTLPNGEIIKVKLDPLKVGWDPSAKAKNLLDARWAYYYEDFDLQEAFKLFQGSKQEDFQEVSDDDASDTGYIYNPFGGLYDKIKLMDSVEWAAKEQEMVRVYNHQWMEYETFYKAYNPLYLVDEPVDALFIQQRLERIAEDIETNGPDDIDSPDMFTFDPTAQEFTFDEKMKRILVKEFGELIDPIPFTRKVFYTCVYSGEHIFTKFRSVCQQGFSIKFKTGVYNARGKFWRGMVNSMMEPQKYYNKALTELMFTIAANSKGGVMVEEDAVEDIADFESKWAKTDAVIKVASGAISENRILQKAQGAVPTGLENIITLSAQAISSAGVDPAFLGNLQDEQSGVLYKRRIRQVISKMAMYFDGITLYQKEDARLHIDLIRVWVQNNEGEWINITGPNGADEFMEISNDMMAGQYTVSIQEASQTPEDKLETATMLGSLGDRLIAINPAAGQGFYAEALQNMSLDGDVTTRLSQLLAPQDGPKIDPDYVQQLEQMVQQLQSEGAKAEVESKMSTAELNKARAAQLMANIDVTLQKTQAETTKILEEARRTAAEVDLATDETPDEVSVSI